MSAHSPAPPQRPNTNTPPMLGSACGKLILLGEHAVVHGVPALVLGVDRRLTAKAVLAAAASDLAPGLRLLQRDIAADDPDELAQAFRALCALEPTSAPVHVHVTGDLPPGVGMGFSAAAGVAIARAVERASKPQDGDGLDEARVEARATAWERVFHGNPSGVDVAAAQRGGCLRYVRGQGTTAVPSRVAPRLCVGLTGTRSSTRVMVQGVADFVAREPARAEACFTEIRALVAAAEMALAEGEHARLGKLLDRNQALLVVMGVSTAAIEQMCEIARDAGALGAKLTGAGGGGAVIALADPQVGGAAIVAAWQAAGFEAFETTTGMASPRAATTRTP